MRTTRIKDMERPLSSTNRVSTSSHYTLAPLTLDMKNRPIPGGLVQGANGSSGTRFEHTFWEIRNASPGGDRCQKCSASEHTERDRNDHRANNLLSARMGGHAPAMRFEREEPPSSWQATGRLSLPNRSTPSGRRAILPRGGRAVVTGARWRGHHGNPEPGHADATTDVRPRRAKAMS
jgi:hypothetical protein